ncbi:mechanosensitive ion channel family protein [Motiliproteus sp. MSK22-1]|uniref:mechanosensitive ion channel family protein n=1 Tax=Motiliproteus sp. MSK22-1 TaxID=1897630 RepID=UPI00097564AF|nr:mechanosensitive ion channel family protein [Motiliproteus sp. MSK22-1]OMH26268.1 mechanosensitive ion channel protein [Motiliproteus sp. MSK22-1]
MDNFWLTLADWQLVDRLLAGGRALFLICLGLLLGKLASKGVKHLLARQLSQHHLILLRRIAFYLILGMFCVSALRELGFKLSVLLGAAGVLTVAVGFASQTSASNIISGLFLLGERPFSVGDVIRVGSTTGEVLSIDLLSAKLRTFENLFVRIPNETLIKSEVTNLTRFPIRRLDLKIGIAYKEDIEKVTKVLKAVADANPLSLEEPEPIIIFTGFGSSSIDLQFSVWAVKEKFMDLRNSIQTEIKIAFDAEGIEIPFPHLTIYTGSATEPFPIQMVGGNKEQATPDNHKS